MKIILMLVLPFIFILTLQSCEKDTSDLGAEAEYSYCRQNGEKDTNVIASKLAGIWKWHSYYCGLCTSIGVHPAFADVVVKFTSDREYTINENSSIIAHGKWHFKKGDGIRWELDTDGDKNYLYGSVLLCGKTAIFSEINLDGPDNLFVKIE